MGDDDDVVVSAPRARDRVVSVALVVAALLATFPGFHLLELHLPRTTAMLISHGVGLALLAAAAVGWWRARRIATRRPGGSSGA